MKLEWTIRAPRIISNLSSPKWVARSFINVRTSCVFCFFASHISCVSTLAPFAQTIGLCVQPRLGAWSDRLNRRVPFVVGLSLIALLGVVVLMAAAPSTRALGFSEHDEDDDGGNASEIHNSIAMPPVAIATAFVGFGLADVCFDCLLIPGRALLHDTSAAADSSRGDELFTGFQMLGRLLALVISSRTGNGLWGLYEGEIVCIASSFSVSAQF